MSDDGPKQPTTVALPAMTDRAILEDLVRELRGARADIGLVSNDLSIVKDRVSIIETWRTEQEVRQSKFSGGIRNLSQSDEGQNAQIASLSVKVDELKADHKALAESQSIQTAIIKATADDVKAFLATPTVKIIGGILFGIFSTWLAKHYGIELPK